MRTKTCNAKQPLFREAKNKASYLQEKKCLKHITKQERSLPGDRDNGWASTHVTYAGPHPTISLLSSSFSSRVHSSLEPSPFSFPILPSFSSNPPRNQRCRRAFFDLHVPAPPPSLPSSLESPAPSQVELPPAVGLLAGGRARAGDAAASHGGEGDGSPGATRSRGSHGGPWRRRWSEPENLGLGVGGVDAGEKKLSWGGGGV
jgi:hypothetical protein